MSQEKLIWLACSECGNRNYTTDYSLKKNSTAGKLELPKFCKTCQKHTPHKQAK